MKNWIGLLLLMSISFTIQAQQSLGRHSELTSDVGVLREDLSKKTSKKMSMEALKNEPNYCLERLKKDNCEPLDISRYDYFDKKMIGKKVRIWGKLSKEFDVDPKTQRILNSKFIIKVESINYEP